jgi:RHS repeat-associated protein
VRQKYTGKERDEETSLDYFGARYFASVQGRFTGVDPLLQSGRPSLPQTWNRYSYVLNNPLKYIDPTGEEWKFVGNDQVSEEELKKAFEAAIKAKAGKNWEKSKEWQAYQAIDKAKGTITVSLGDLKSDTRFGTTNTSFSWTSKGGKLDSLTVSGSITLNTNSKAIDISNFTDLVTASSHEYNHVLSGLAGAKTPGFSTLAPPDNVVTPKDRRSGLSDFRVEAAAFRAQVRAEEVTRSMDGNRPVSPDTALGRVTRGVAGTKTNRELYDYLTDKVNSKFKQPRP